MNSVSRGGGDEFAALVTGDWDENSETILQRWQRNLVKFNELLSRPYRLDMSVGIECRDPQDLSSLEEMLNRADKPMYERKQNRRGK